jgi:hypothetical protein
MDSERVFTEIYGKNVWGDGSSNSPRSGDGSKPENAKPYVHFVQSIVKSYGINSVLDLGHGDWVMWQDYKFEDVVYIGIDVALGLSEEIGHRFANENRRFFHNSVFDSGLPKVDLVISKEVFQHLSNQDVIEKLKEINEFKFLILSNAYYSSKLIFERVKYWIQLRVRLNKLLHLKNPLYKVKPLRNNTDIITGGFRGLDLERSPFIEHLMNYEIVEKFDYPGRKGSASHIRTYFLVRQDAHLEDKVRA